jgi:hypothetical protein
MMDFILFLVQFCDVVTLANHPQEELAKFDYKSERKIQNFKNPPYSLPTCWNPLSKYGTKKEIKSSKFGDFVQFFLKNLLYHVALDIYIFGCSDAKICQQKKILIYAQM